MSDDGKDDPEKAPRRGKMPLILGLVLALCLAAAGFFATHSGLIGPPGHAGEEEAVAELPEIDFVPIEPVTVSLPDSAAHDHLRFTAQIEVASPHASEVQALMPRILDVMNGYLRAVDPASLQETGALARLRAQLLRRIQIVTGEGRVRDLLVTEFILG